MKLIRYIALVLIAGQACQSSTEFIPVRYKLTEAYTTNNPAVTSGFLYGRQQLLAYADSLVQTTYILDSSITFGPDTVFRTQYSLIDTVEYQIDDNKGHHSVTVIQRNQNKSHLQFYDTKDSASFSRITYAMPKISDEIQGWTDTVETFNYSDSKLYEIGNKKFRIYCFAYLGMCEDCDYCVYFSKDFGEMASYSIDWDNLSVVDSIGNPGKDKWNRKLIRALVDDSLFFPYPEHIRQQRDKDMGTLRKEGR